MSNFRALATVTATLSEMLQAALDLDVPGATVSASRPDGGAAGVTTRGVNIYLYQVSPNPFWCNMDLPTRDGDGQLVQRPRAAVDLHYLLTCYGSEADLEPQLVLGCAVRTLHSQPILTRQMVRDTIGGGRFGFLAQSNLAEDVELVRFTPLPLSLEDLSKLWSVFFQTAYSLSVAYEASVVLLETDDVPRAILPVRERNVYALPFRQPVITAVDPQIATTGATLTLVGTNLLSGETAVKLDDTEISPDAGSTSTRLQITLPASLAAGVIPTQVVQRISMGTPEVAHRGFESNVAAFILQPAVNTVSASGGTDPGITVDLTPTPAATQRITLLLNELTSPPPVEPTAYRLEAEARTLDTDPVEFRSSSVPSGTYLVRVRVDDAESSLGVDADGRFDSPTVTV